jgi:hypothetical protein
VLARAVTPASLGAPAGAEAAAAPYDVAEPLPAGAAAPALRLVRFVGAAGLHLWSRLPPELAWMVAVYVPAPPRKLFAGLLDACSAGDPFPAAALQSALAGTLFEFGGRRASARGHLLAHCGRLVRKRFPAARELIERVFGFGPELVALRCERCSQDATAAPYECPCEQSGVLCASHTPEACRGCGARDRCGDRCKRAEIRRHKCDECSRFECVRPCNCRMWLMYGIDPRQLNDSDTEPAPQMVSWQGEVAFGRPSSPRILPDPTAAPWSDELDGYEKW